MIDADAINASIEANRQAILRKQFASGTVKHYCGKDDTFDEIPGGMLARRDERVALKVIPPNEYGG